MRVLVVEDERDTAEALSWGLRAEGYVVDVALGRQPPRQGLGGVLLVLDHQHAHDL